MEDCGRIVDAMCTLFGDKYRPSITLQTTMDDIPEWDSLSFIQLVIIIEKQFGTRFSMTEMAHLNSVEKIREVLASKGLL